MAQPKLFLAIVAGLLLVLSTLHLTQRLYNFSYHDLPAGLPTAGSHAEPVSVENESSYLLGVGKGDITGPVVEINFMGYADTSQVGSGLRQRLYSRAMIVGDISEMHRRWVYLVLDTQSGDTAVRHGILQALKDLGDEYAVYGNQNVAVTGTHSHSGPGAWVNYLLPQITSKGFHRPSYEAIVNGAVTSIRRAHESLAPGRLSVGMIPTLGVNVNRSPFAYQANPADERSMYDEDVDKNMTVLKFSRTIDGEDRAIGLLSWMSVHGTSMYGNNTLVTGDNKGVAAYLLERSVDDSFVAAFSQANVGDTSPNVEGPFCEFGDQAGQQCDFETSLCAGKTQPCHGRGPHWGLHDSGTASTFEIGRRQFLAAKTLLDSADLRPITGKVGAAHRFVDFSNLSVALANGTTVKTCPAALGHSFAAGTSDGPGKFDFKQAQPGDPHTNPLWSLIGNRIHKPNETQKACQGVKPILLDVGESFSPYAWAPNIVDVQLLRVGELFIIVSPGEATTMAGRRWKAALSEEISNADRTILKPQVVLGGPANSYTHYITTEEEYLVQRYEGASTLYGPHTLAAYVAESRRLLPELLKDDSTWTPDKVDGPLPPVNTNNSLSFINEPILDRPGLFREYGQVLNDADAHYVFGETVSATFVGANPRNNLRLDETFAAVEKYDEKTATWETVRNDADWSLVYSWRRTSTVLGTSEVTISWETKWETGKWATAHARSLDQSLMMSLSQGKDTELAKYRLRYYGDSKSLGGNIMPFTGTSGIFSFEERSNDGDAPT